ncbi:MAG: transglutaminase domain-containing protein, partial [Bradymonadaceae bacterium]
MPTHLRRLLATAAVAALAVVAAPDRAGADDSSDEDESIDVSALVDRVRSIRRTSRDIRNTSDERPTTVDAAVDEAGHDPDAVFDWVDEEIDFVPYKGSMRGPTGALEAGAANAVDRARLLASMFENLGLKTRFASARLDRQTADELIRKYTGRAKLVATDEVDAESIESANTAGFADRFRGLVRRHVWVEIRRPDDDGDWIAADPLLTDELGSPTVEAERHFESIDERHAAHLTISLEA